jgi:hypothetical protein
MIKRFILMTAVLFSSRLFSQDLVDLYLAHLPDYVNYNEDVKNMVNGQLVAKANVHPDLIYFQIERIHLQILEPDNNIRRQRLLFFEEREKKYIRQRTEWAYTQLEQLNKSNYHQDIKASCATQFEKLIIDTKERAHSLSGYALTIDLAKQEYYKYIYYSKTNIPFDPSVNYKDACEAYQREKYRSIQLLDTQLKNQQTTVPVDSVSELIKYWYLFEQNNKSTWAFELIAQNADNYDKKIPFYRFGIGFGYIFNHSFDIIHDIDIPGLSQPGEIFETSETDQIYIALHGYIPLNKSWMQFTYLNIELDAAFSASNYRMPFYADYNIHSQVKDTLYVAYLKFNTNEILIERRNTYFIRISTPVYSVSRKFFVDLGIGAGINRIDYELNYQYDYFNRKNYYEETEDGLILRSIYSVNDSSAYVSESRTDNQFFYVVSLDLRYLFSNGIFLNFAINPNFLAIKIGYNF